MHKAVLQTCLALWCCVSWSACSTQRKEGPRDEERGAPIVAKRDEALQLPVEDSGVEESPLAAAPEPLPVRVRGFVSVKPLYDGTQGYELCPQSYRAYDCYGIVVLGEVPQELLATTKQASLVEARGLFDGMSLQMQSIRRVGKERLRARTPQAWPLSQAELDVEQAQIRRILKEQGAGSFTLGGPDQSRAFSVQLEAVDATLRERLQNEVGVDLFLEYFIELEEHPLHALPAPRERGDFRLETAPARSSRMLWGLASKRMSLHVDRELGCVYLQGEKDEERWVPFLPFGYFVKDHPVRLLNYDGQLVAREGELLAWGGSKLRSKEEARELGCGAKQAWVGAP